MSQIAAVADDATLEPTPRYPVRVLLAGIVARTWLWFVAGCIIITLLPFLIGWRSYDVESGSMLPKLAVGDVVIASPNPSPDDLLGRVTVFTDPDGGKTKVHRVTAINGDGTLTTKGDNNPTPDLDRVREVQVRGTVWYAIPYLGWASAALTGEWRVWVIPVAVFALFGYAGFMVFSALRDRARSRNTDA